MSDNYKGARTITTSGLTLTNGTFAGFIGTSTQNVTIAGARIFDNSGSNLAGITIAVSTGTIIPIKCQHIKPASGIVIGLID